MSSSAVGLARRVVPWLVATALLALAFALVPFEQFVAALERAALGWFVPLAVILLVGIYLTDSLALAKTFSWFTAPFSYADALAIRGASYLLSAINYNLGQGAIVLFVTRSSGVGAAAATGTVLLIMGINMVMLLVLVGISMLIGGAELNAWLVPWEIGLLAAFALYLLVVALRPAVLTRLDLLRPLFSAGLRGHVAAMAVRLPHVILIFVTHYAGLRAFGVQVPVADYLALMPVVFVVAVLPLSPQGLGTTQLAAVHFFSAFAPGDPDEQRAAVLAYSLFLTVFSTLYMMGLGLLWYRRGLRMLGWQEKDSAPTRGI